MVLEVFSASYMESLEEFPRGESILRTSSWWHCDMYILTYLVEESLEEFLGGESTLGMFC